MVMNADADQEMDVEMEEEVEEEMARADMVESHMISNMIEEVSCAVCLQ